MIFHLSKYHLSEDFNKIKVFTFNYINYITTTRISDINFFYFIITIYIYITIINLAFVA